MPCGVLRRGSWRAQAGAAGTPRRRRWRLRTGGRRSCRRWPRTRTGASARRATRSAWGSVALSRCTTAHPLYTRSTNIFGASVSEAVMRPNPRAQTARMTSTSARAARAATAPPAPVRRVHYGKASLSNHFAYKIDHAFVPQTASRRTRARARPATRATAARARWTRAPPAPTAAPPTRTPSPGSASQSARPPAQARSQGSVTFTAVKCCFVTFYNSTRA